jgi:hypothetical protein
MVYGHHHLSVLFFSQIAVISPIRREHHVKGSKTRNMFRFPVTVFAAARLMTMGFPDTRHISNVKKIKCSLPHACRAPYFTRVRGVGLVPSWFDTAVC